MIGKIAWKNLMYKPLNTALCVSLLTFGVAIISLLLVLQHALEQKFQRDLQQTDLVVGAKGSPLQLVLSAIYHLDAPTGNIKLAEARPVMENPMVAEAIPLAYGDSYRGYRIVGTTLAYIDKYEAVLQTGRLFSQNMEAVIGATVAVSTGLQVGDIFLGTHGEVQQGGHVHDNDPYTVVGILAPTQTVLDNLVLCNVPSVWQVHTHTNHDLPPVDTLHATELHFEHDHKHHDHDHHEHEAEDDVITADSMEITALLLKYKSKMAMLNMPRLINDQTNMQAVLPALEINRLFYMLGVGANTLQLIAAGIMLMAGFSVFFVLYSRLRDRRYEMALLRSVGYKRQHLFSLLLLEGLLLAIIGYVLGWVLSRLGLGMLNRQAASDFNWQIATTWTPQEIWLFVITIGIGLLSALLPAWYAMRMNVSAALSAQK